jgi:hypothetical protein
MVLNLPCLIEPFRVSWMTPLVRIFVLIVIKLLLKFINYTFIPIFIDEPFCIILLTLIVNQTTCHIRCDQLKNKSSRRVTYGNPCYSIGSKANSIYFLNDRSVLVSPEESSDAKSFKKIVQHCSLIKTTCFSAWLLLFSRPWYFFQYSFPRRKRFSLVTWKMFGLCSCTEPPIPANACHF